MTNITLSIEEEVYSKMKKHSEIKWSEFVRKSIRKRIEELESIEGLSDNESIMNMLASQESLKEDWDNELDVRWDDV
jgi:predicted CopG family antitoxin